MKLFWSFATLLKQHLVLVITLTAVLATLAGHYFDMSSGRELILLLTILIVLPMMIDFPLQSIFSLGDIKVLILAQALNFLIIPFIGYFLGAYFFPQQPSYALGLLFIALLPTSGGMTISWTGIAEGNVMAAIKLTVIGLLLGALCAPFYIELLLAKSVSLSLVSVLKQIGIIVFLPLFIGQVIRFYLFKKFGKEYFATQIKSKLPAVSTLGLIGLIFVAVSLKASTILAKPVQILYLFIPLGLFYLTAYFLAYFFGKVLVTRQDTVALVYGTGLRSLGLALALAMSLFGEHGPGVALMLALAFIIQVQSASWFARIVRI